MNSFIFSLILLVALAPADLFASSKAIKGERVYGTKIVGKVQYIQKGIPLLDLERAPYVAIVDHGDNSIKVSFPYFGNEDSLFIQFIPGNLIDVRLSASAQWIDSLSSFKYNYVIFSDRSSLRPIWEFEVEWLTDYRGVESPKGWTADRIPFLPRKSYTWTAFQENDDLLPGDSLYGIGLISSSPPLLASFTVWGRSRTIAEKSPASDVAANEALGRIYAEIESETRDVKGYTIIPGTPPETIEPAEWVFRVDAGLNKLEYWGYLEEPEKKAVHNIIIGLQATLKRQNSHSRQKLEQEINNALVALEPYQNQMEPEAWAFITENLKYVLRHMDIVTFKEYP